MEEFGVHSRHVEDCHVETHLDVVVSSTLSLRKIMKPYETYSFGSFSSS